MHACYVHVLRIDPARLDAVRLDRLWRSLGDDEVEGLQGGRTNAGAGMGLRAGTSTREKARMTRGRAIAHRLVMVVYLLSLQGQQMPPTLLRMPPSTAARLAPRLGSLSRVGRASLIRRCSARRRHRLRSAGAAPCWMLTWGIGRWLPRPTLTNACCWEVSRAEQPPPLVAQPATARSSHLHLCTSRLQGRACILPARKIQGQTSPRRWLRCSRRSESSASCLRRLQQRGWRRSERPGPRWWNPTTHDGLAARLWRR